MNENVERLRDRVALQDEHSYVDRGTRERIRSIIMEGGEREELAAASQRIAEGLSTDEVAQIVADWIDAQHAI